uniref:SGS domain-containing protein n=1 Tax=Mesocestoides corti TaxID=53468 RepID=A0A5K3FY15_MESCO
MNIELKMAKLTSSSWSCLEGELLFSAYSFLGVPPSNQAEGEPKKHGKSYKDWDAVAKEADEIEEGDPLNSLFQKIFKDADDDTRRAMIKSFVSPAFATG